MQVWPDEPGLPVTAAQFRDVEDRVLALYERIAAVRGIELPDRDVLFDYPRDPDDKSNMLYALAARVPMGPADRYAVLAAPSAADRLAALLEAVDSVTAMVEFACPINHASRWRTRATIPAAADPVRGAPSRGPRPDRPR